MRTFRRCCLLVGLTLVAMEGAAAGSSAPDTVAGRTLAEWTADLDSPNEIVQLRAAKTLQAFGPEAVPALVAALDSTTPGVRYWAASGLGDLGIKNNDALPKLRMMVKSNSVGLQIAAAYALCRLGDIETGLPVLTAALRHPERGTANSAADFLARIGPPAKDAVPALEEATKHNDAHISKAALEALRRIRGVKPRF
ncbi:MAG: HEAT repeat domain-containing protein [Planctomycetaceae bacterium]